MAESDPASTDETTVDPADAAGASSADAASSAGDIEDRFDNAQADIDAMLQAQGVGSAAEEPAAAAAPEKFALDELHASPAGDSRQPIDLIGDVEMDLHVELGRTMMRLEDVLKLRDGSVVALDKLAGDPVDVFANGRLIARGKVLVMNDNFCVRVTELIGA